MAMYYYASKISAIACGTRCRRSVLQKSRGQRDRDKYAEDADADASANADDDDDGALLAKTRQCETAFLGDADGAIYATAESALAEKLRSSNGGGGSSSDGVRHRRRHSEQLDGYDIELGFQKLEVSAANATKATTYTGYGLGSANLDSSIAQYDIPKNSHRRACSDINYESSVLGTGGIMYINGRIVSGPLESLIEVLVPKNLIDFDKEFIFAFLLSSRLFLRPHELLGKLLSSVPDSESLESLVALLAEWTHKFPYDYRDERMMGHVKHIVARCSNTNLEAVVSEILSALLKQLTDLERHEEDLRACQITNDKPETNILDCPTASQYAQILCRLEKKLAKQIGPEEFLQCSSNVLLDKQKKWDQPSSSGGPPGVQDPKKTCNLETYLDWSARLRLFVCNEILQCIGIRDRSKTVELWSGVAQYCLLVGNYNSATAILESLESPPIARLKITWSKLQVTCQQLDCMQRHAEGHGDLWHKQSSILNENHQKTDMAAVVFLSTTAATATTSATMPPPAQTAVATAAASALTPTPTAATSAVDDCINSNSNVAMQMSIAAAATTKLCSDGSSGSGSGEGISGVYGTEASKATNALGQTEAAAAAAAADMKATFTGGGGSSNSSSNGSGSGSGNGSKKIIKAKTATVVTATTAAVTAASAAAATPTAAVTKPNDWVVIPVFADIVKLALAGREECLQRLPNGHINIVAFDRMAAIVGAFTKHMHSVKAPSEAPPGEYKTFCQHMQHSSRLNESELMMASFDCEEPNNAEKLMYDLN